MEFGNRKIRNILKRVELFSWEDQTNPEEYYYNCEEYLKLWLNGHVSLRNPESLQINVDGIKPSVSSKICSILIFTCQDYYYFNKVRQPNQVMIQDSVTRFLEKHTNYSFVKNKNILLKLIDYLNAYLVNLARTVLHNLHVYQYIYLCLFSILTFDLSKSLKFLFKYLKATLSIPCGHTTT